MNSLMGLLYCILWIGGMVDGLDQSLLMTHHNAFLQSFILPFNVFQKEMKS